jgi:translation initiation factor 1 (eIF-1/SUI1)
MVDISNINLDSKDKCALEKIDRHIYIKFFREKKTSRTYILGLSDFMDGPTANKFANGLKKKLGTGMIETEQDGKISYGFQGDHIAKIKEFLITDAKIPKEKIK